MNEEIENTEEVSERPNESAGVHFSSFLKITDPNTGEVVVTLRDDD